MNQNTARQPIRKPQSQNRSRISTVWQETRVTVRIITKSFKASNTRIKIPNRKLNIFHQDLSPSPTCASNKYQDCFISKSEKKPKPLNKNSFFLGPVWQRGCDGSSRHASVPGESAVVAWMVLLARANPKQQICSVSTSLPWSSGNTDAWLHLRKWTGNWG